MLKTFALASTLLISMALPSQAQSMYWVNLGSSNTGSYVDIDTNSIQRQGSLVAYFSRLRLSRQDRSGAMILGSVEIANCNTGEFKTLKTMGLNRNGKIIFNQNYKNPPVQPIAVGSLAHSKYNFVCEQQSQYAGYDALRGLTVTDYININDSVNRSIETIFKARY